MIAQRTVPQLAHFLPQKYWQKNIYYIISICVIWESPSCFYGLKQMQNAWKKIPLFSFLLSFFIQLFLLFFQVFADATLIFPLLVAETFAVNADKQ